MEPACDFCGVLRAVVYCKSDMARLCIPCDGCVHSANALSRRHARSLLCDKCSSQPAIVWCVDDKMSMCQACEWSNGNGGGCSSLGHRCQILDTYTGCAFLGELPRIFPSVLLDGNNNCSSNSVSNTSLGQLSSLSLNENCGSNSLEQRDNEGSIALVTSKLDNELEPWMGNSPPIPPNLDSYIPNCSSDQAQLAPPFFSEDSNDPKVQGCSNFKEIKLPDDDDLCGLNIEDVQLNLEESEELFGCSQGQSRYRFEELGDDPLFMDKNLSVATQSDGPIENALEASSSGQHDSIAFQSSCVVGRTVNMAINCGAASSMFTNPSFNDRNINLGFPPAAQVNSSMAISLSNITGESSAADYQDCGLSPVFLPGEAPWESSLEASSPQARDKAKMRYNEKKKTRTFGKQIRYASRKARADTRKRVKGRFVKAGDAYDYDPLGQE